MFQQKAFSKTVLLAVSEKCVSAKLQPNLRNVSAFSWFSKSCLSKNQKAKGYFSKSCFSKTSFSKRLTVLQVSWPVLSL
jgi:hypothetical protein